LSALNQRVIEPPPPPYEDPADLAPDAWGFRDTSFAILPNGNATLTGARYQLAGMELPELVPWVKRTLQTSFERTDANVGVYPPAVPPARPNAEFQRRAIERLGVEWVSGDPLLRLRRGHGHTLEEIYAVRHEGIARVPDLVVFPAGDADCKALVQLAKECNVVLVPYGGGTCVSEALRIPAEESRSIVAVDMRRMNRIRWIDPVNRIACIEAGAVGRQITAQLAGYGFTMGHEPDSYEFSTLGGWVATNASGMKKNRYGNIEDLVVDFDVVTPSGEIVRPHRAPRESTGPDARRMLFGSEGSVGIVTSAVVKIFPLPEAEEFDALLFKSFEDGVAFMHELALTGDWPASARLVDNLQFQLSQTLKPKAEGLAAIKRKLEKWVVTAIKGFAPTKMVACTLVFEGTADLVARQRATVKRLAKQYGAMAAGSENGKKGYQLTFGIAYIRDFVLRHGVLGESFETSMEWQRVIPLVDAVKRRIADEAKAKGVTTVPFVTARVTQIYHAGAVVYFYLGLGADGLEHPLEVYAHLENSARDEILRQGGSLSHHHGIGKRRRHFMPRVHPPAALAVAKAMKQALDPTNVFGIGNL
jgi:alkyldihydroxyacetonephosphate synthase